MLHVKPKKSKSGINLNVNLHGKTIVTFLIFTISGILVGRSIWEYGINYIGLHATTLLGVISFIITGLILHKFKK